MLTVALGDTSRLHQCSKKEKTLTDWPLPTAQLRAAAEQALAATPWTSAPDRPADELLHELQVHQLELAMQNESLRQALIALEASRDRYAALYDFAPVGYVTLTPSGQIAEANLTSATLLGMNRVRIRGQRFDRFISDRDREPWNLAFIGVKQREERVGVELMLHRGDGRTFPAWVDCLRVEGDGSPPAIRLTLTDISESVAHRRLAEEARLSANVVENSIEGVMVTDLAGVIQMVNPAFTQITGYAANEAIGQTPNLVRSERQHPSYYRAMWDALVAQGRWEGELWNRKKTGEAYLASLTISVVRDHQGQPAQYVAVFHDVTTMRQDDADMRHWAFHDALTGLPNRALLQDRLRHALARAIREKRTLALAFIDLDGFKPVNDSLGHAAGDQLLQEVAQRIKRRVRAMDTVARLGGDEFLILAEDATSQECATLARDVLEEISMHVTIGNHSVTIAASIGIAVYPGDGVTDTDLMRSADAAMYRAKAAGRGVYCMAGADASPR